MIAALTGAAGDLSGLGFGRYLAGCAVLAIAGALVVPAARAARRALVPWVGAPARLAEATVGLAMVVLVAFVVGGAHGFTGWGVLAGLAVASLAVHLVARRVGPAAGPAPAPTARPAVAAAIVAVGALTLVGAGWVAHTGFAWGHGMTEGDTLWYHGVFAARFVQEGRLDLFPHVGAAAQGYFPANSQMLHAIAYFPFDRDVLSPVLNIVLAALAVLAAYCVGRRRGLGWHCSLAAAAVLGMPAVIGTHPGQATNDLLCATFLLMAVALLVEGGAEPGPVGLAAAAGALALGTKLTVAVPLTVVTVVILGIAVVRRRPRLALAWLVPLVGLGAFWFVRNWALVDNPLPWYDLRLGPLHLPVRSRLEDNASIADFLGREGTWSRVWYPGLRLAFGRAWWLFAAAPFVAGLAVLGRDRTMGERIAGAVAVAAGVGYVTMPFTMELGGAAFAATARYAAPALLCGLVVLPVALHVERWAVARVVTLAVLGTVVVVDAFARDVDRFAPWRGNRLAAVAVTGLLLLVIGAFVVAGRHGRRLLVAPLVLALVLAGFAVQGHYLEHRYARGSGLRLERISEYLSGAEPATVLPFGTIQFYPFFGPAYRNRVVDLDVATTPRSGDPVARCREWQAALRAARPSYLLVAREFVPKEQPRPEWFVHAGGLRVVARDGDARLYEVTGPIRLRCGA